MAEKPVGETVGLKPLPGKALRGASTVWGGFKMCVSGLVEILAKGGIATFGKEWTFHDWFCLCLAFQRVSV